MWHECKLTLGNISCKDCVLLHCGSSYPLPPLPWCKVRALTPLAADWFRGVPSPYHPSLPVLTLSPFCFLPFLPAPFSVPLIPGYSPHPPSYCSICCWCSLRPLPDWYLRLQCLLPLPCVIFGPPPIDLRGFGERAVSSAAMTQWVGTPGD